MSMPAGTASVHSVGVGGGDATVRPYPDRDRSLRNRVVWYTRRVTGSSATTPAVATGETEPSGTPPRVTPPAGTAPRRASPLAVGVVVWLASELMFFGGLFAAYYTLRSVDRDWPPAGVELDTLRALLFTVVLVSSSVTMHVSVLAA